MAAILDFKIIINVVTWLTLYIIFTNYFVSFHYYILLYTCAIYMLIKRRIMAAILEHGGHIEFSKAASSVYTTLIILSTTLPSFMLLTKSAIFFIFYNKFLHYYNYVVFILSSRYCISFPFSFVCSCFLPFPLFCLLLVYVENVKN